MSDDGEEEGEASASASPGLGKVVLVKAPSVPWDPLSSPDWDRESHSKEALLRIKRLVMSWGIVSLGVRIL